jgi:hypothetical protein
VPDNLTFSIIVALLISILTLPITVFIIFILEAYGSTWPGSRGYVDDIGDKKEGKEGEEEKEGKESKGEERVFKDGAQALRDETFVTEFGQLVQKTEVMNTTSASIAQNVYDDYASPGEEAMMLTDKVSMVEVRVRFLTFI